MFTFEGPVTGLNMYDMYSVRSIIHNIVVLLLVRKEKLVCIRMEYGILSASVAAERAEAHLTQYSLS